MATGFLDSSGDPHVEIEVIGVYGKPTKMTCLVDTGFSGFLTIPLLQAFPIGLVLRTTTSVTFANSETENRLTCLGIVRVDGRDETGLILVDSRGGEPILGMDFLRKFNFRLTVCPSTGSVEFVHVPPPPPPPAAPAAPATAATP